MLDCVALLNSRVGAVVGMMLIQTEWLDPVLRRPGAHQALPGEVPKFQGPVWALGRAYQCYASILPYVFWPLFLLGIVVLTRIVWIGLESLGFGANLQHYNPLIDSAVAKQWDVPTEWRLISQLVFGSPEVEAQEKPKKPVEERVKIYGKL